MSYNHEEANEKSLTKFESMLKTNRVLFFDSSEFENIIHYYLNRGKFSLAKKAIKLGLEQHPTSTNLKLFRVEIYVFENKIDEANKLLNELYILEPNNEEIYIQKANILSKDNKHDLAIDVLKKAIELTEENSDIYALIGMEYLFLDKFEEAKQSFMKCLEKDVEDYTSLYNVIYCFDFLEQPQKAIDYLTSYIDKNPYCEVAWHQLGKQYLELDKPNKAIEAFDFAIFSDDTFIGAYIEKGNVLEQQKKYTEAINNYLITLELEDPTSYALLRIGMCYEKLGDKKLAVKYYYKTVHEDPQLDKGWVAITKFYLKDKNYKKALYYINKALQIDSEVIKYWKLYAKINYELSFLEETEQGLQKILDLGNFELDVWLLRSDVLIKLDESRASITNLLQASEYYPEHAEIQFRLGGLYLKLSEIEKATYHLKNAMLFDETQSYILNDLFPELMTHKTISDLLN